MAETHMIRCTAKDGDRVTHIGGTNSNGTAWKMSAADAIAGVKSGKFKFYVNVVDQQSKGIWITLSQKQGKDELSTDEDPSLLLRLPNCP